MVELTYANSGKEPHSSAMVKAAPGATFADVKGALLSARGPASGPRPFEQFGGAPTADPDSGVTTMTFELRPGKTVEDAVRWLTTPAGPPPHRARSGVAIKPGGAATVELDLEPDVDYAFVCVIPDSRGDLAPHVAKGMFTPAFRA